MSVHRVRWLWVRPATADDRVPQSARRHGSVRIAEGGSSELDGRGGALAVPDHLLDGVDARCAVQYVVDEFGLRGVALLGAGSVSVEVVISSVDVFAALSAFSTHSSMWVREGSTEVRWKASWVIVATEHLHVRLLGALG